jgi:hypothetical protein
MAMAQKKTTARTKEEPKRIEIGADINRLSGRYANHIQVTVQGEEFVLDFLARMGEQATLVSRVFVSPMHAQRLMELLRRQIAKHKTAFPDSPLKRRAKRE